MMPGIARAQLSPIAHSRNSGLTSRRLLLDEFPHGHSGGFGPVDVAHSIRDHAFAHALRLGFRTQAWNKSSDRAVPHAADPDAPLEAGIKFRVRLMVGHVDDVVPVD